MCEVTVIVPGGGELIADAPDRRVEILCEHDGLHATWSWFGPRREGAGLHVHRRHSDLFYVLQGELTLMLGPEGRGVVVPTGTLARVPPLVVHGFRNGSDAELRYLNLHVPGEGFADYLRAMRDGRTLAYDQEEPPPDGGRPATEAMVGGRGCLAADIEIRELGLAAGDSPPSQVHEHHVAAFYVLAGELLLGAGGRELRARGGSWVQVPPGAAHTVRSRGSERVRFLDLRTPDRPVSGRR